MEDAEFEVRCSGEPVAWACGPRTDALRGDLMIDILRKQRGQ